MSVPVAGAANPYRYTRLRGTVTIVADADKTLPETLSHDCRGENPPSEGPEVERGIVRLHVEKVAGNVR